MVRGRSSVRSRSLAPWRYAKVAQLVEQSLRKRWVVGSIPTFGSFDFLVIEYMVCIMIKKPK